MGGNHTLSFHSASSRFSRPTAQLTANKRSADARHDKKSITTTTACVPSVLLLWLHRRTIRTPHSKRPRCCPLLHTQPPPVPRETPFYAAHRLRCAKTQQPPQPPNPPAGNKLRHTTQTVTPTATVQSFIMHMITNQAGTLFAQTGYPSPLPPPPPHPSTFPPSLLSQHADGRLSPFWIVPRQKPTNPENPPETPAV